MSDLDTFDPLDPEFIADPYPWYHLLREDHPVRWIPSRGYWMVTGYDEVKDVLHDAATYSSKLGYAQMATKMSGVEMERGQVLHADASSRMLISEDPPVHTQFRKIVTRVFTPRAVNDLEPRLREVCRDMVGVLARNLDEGKADLVTDLAAPFPVIVIAELLGIPAERRLDFRRWSDAISGTLSGDVDMEKAAEGGLEMFMYMTDAVEARTKEPGDDLISKLVGAMDDSPESITAQEVVLFAILLLAGGNETTSNLIGNAVSVLTERPDVDERLRADPSLIPDFVEEVLRWDPPIQGFMRGTTKATTLAGVELSEGELLVTSFGAANRDPRHFDDPDRFDPDRGATDHLAFGHGPHFCLGASLARKEARLALESLFEAGVELHRGPAPKRTMGTVLRGYSSFPLAKSPA